MYRFCCSFLNLYALIGDNSPPGLRIYQNDCCFSSAFRAEDSCSSYLISAAIVVLLMMASFLPVVSPETISELIVCFVNTLALSAKGCPLTLILNAFVQPKGALLTENLISFAIFSINFRRS